jgi:peptidoglycan/xylan/chitin deacetylase (PgdA/CDA1 family)
LHPNPIRWHFPGRDAKILVMGMLPALAAAGGSCAVGGTLSWAAVAPSSQLFGPTIRRTGDASAIALTFDDGPNPAATPALLALLERYNAKATFFLIGRNVRTFPALAKEIAARGHVIGNHTETHPRLAFLPPARIADELSRCDDAIEAATGKKPRWMRPPFGFRGPQLGGVVRRHGSAGVVMWSVWARDWKPQPPEPVIQRLRRVGGGDIVLLHDGDHRVLEGDRRHTVAALEHWLPRWKDAGLRFVTLDEIE